MKKIKTFSSQICKSVLICTLLLSLFVSSLTMRPQPAQAQANCCSCLAIVISTEISEWIKSLIKIFIKIELEFLIHKLFFKLFVWKDGVLGAMKFMAEQLSAVAMQQSFIVGTFMDAKHRLETQQILQTLNARAHKDYHPSIGMCEFGSEAKSLAASDRKTEINAFALSQRAQDRNLGNKNSAAGTDADDMANRLRTFRMVYCDPADNEEGLDYVCQWNPSNRALTPGEKIGASSKGRMNNDIDYGRIIDWPWTLDVDLTNGADTTDEKDVFALATNLYSDEVFFRPPPETLAPDPSGQMTNAQKVYQDARSLMAKRSVAENSFDAVAAMKAAGTEGSKEYLLGLLRQLGVSGDEAEDLLGSKSHVNPSYYAQMEILAKKIYQDPDFYTHLYDKPVNVERKNVAMEAIGLMQKFDLFKSYIRNEATLSVLLELAVSDVQGEIEGEIGRQKSGGTPAEE
ncbi:MAG: hypothetical protein K9G62_03365 [Alphaproteobacteria bacterium]|nr:hypothetical protein [Alphaproteobacteria bacterium]